MRGGSSSAVTGILLLIGCGGLYFLSRSFFPRLATAILVILAVLFISVILLVAAVMYFAFWKPKDNRQDGEAAEAENVQKRGRAGVVQIRTLLMRIKDRKIRKQGEEICDLINNVMKTVKEQQEEYSKIRYFLNYYLPTMETILLKYHRLEDSKNLQEDTKENVLSCLENIKAATLKQHASLFEDDLLDLTVEMEVLTAMCKKDGLLEEK